MADRPAAIQGTFSDYKLVKTRSVLQLVIEVPVERQAEVFAALGYPMPGEEKLVAVARLQPAKEVMPHTERQNVPDDKAQPPSHIKAGADPMQAARTRAVLLCKDRRFQEYLGHTIDMGPRGAAERYSKEWVRFQCGITSRTEIATNRDAYERFLALEARYRQATGQMAEERG